MSDQRERIDQALRATRRQAFLQDVRAAWWQVGGLVLILLAMSYWFASPRTLVDHVVGVADGAHQPASDTGRDPLQLTVVLNDGRRVPVTLPPGQIYRARTPIELDVYRRDWPPHAVTYRFVRYADRD